MIPLRAARAHCMACADVGVVMREGQVDACAACARLAEAEWRAGREAPPCPAAGQAPALRLVCSK